MESNPISGSMPVAHLWWAWISLSKCTYRYSRRCKPSHRHCHLPAYHLRRVQRKGLAVHLLPVCCFTILLLGSVWGSAFFGCYFILTWMYWNSSVGRSRTIINNCQSWRTFFFRAKLTSYNGIASICKSVLTSDALGCYVGNFGRLVRIFLAWPALWHT